MCGRFTQTQSVDQLAMRFKIAQIGFEPQPHYNIAPSQPIATVMQEKSGARVLDAFRWGLIPSWPKMKASATR